ncbi:MAG: FAD:protein FMN transferase, partial [Methylophilaceae bacterium]
MLLIFGYILISCSHKEPLYNSQSYVFGTLVDISIYGESEQKALAYSNEVMHSFQELHQRLHAWQPSEIKTINQAFSQGSTALSVRPDIATMIADATALSILSQGAFNPAIGSLISTWGFHHDEFKPVKIDATKINDLVRANPQMTDIIIEAGKISSKNTAVQLDLGGYAKGYALDKALVLLRKHGVKHALINIGGNIIALGQHGDTPWRVGIQHPRQPNAIATVDLPSGWAIGTSGDYQRYFTLNGKRYCHIIDPASGYPVEGTQSVTVLIPPQPSAGTLSDVASKPIFIANRNKRAEAAKRMQVTHYLIIESSHRIQISAAMAKRLTWLDQNAAKQAMVIA